MAGTVVLASLIRILVIVGVSVGVAACYVGNKGLSWVPDAEQLEAKRNHHETLRARAGVNLEQFLKLIEQGAIVIDARSREEYEAGHLAIDCDVPVLNVSPHEIDAHVHRLMQLQSLPVVVFCASPTCDYAEELYVALQQFGFTDIWIYFPGWEEIVKLGLKTATGPDTWTGFYDEPTEPPADGGAADGDEEGLEANTPAESEP